MSMQHAFPSKLYSMLQVLSLDQEGRGGITWLPHGRAFMIIDKVRFLNEVIPLYFSQTKIRSFIRQLHLWGFKRVLDGRDRGAWYHTHFIRGCPSELGLIARVPIKKNQSTSDMTSTDIAKLKDPWDTPNFYEMPPIQPEKDEDFRFAVPVDLPHGTNWESRQSIVESTTKALPFVPTTHCNSEFDSSSDRNLSRGVSNMNRLISNEGGFESPHCKSNNAQSEFATSNVIHHGLEKSDTLMSATKTTPTLQKTNHIDVPFQFMQQMNNVNLLSSGNMTHVIHAPQVDANRNLCAHSHDDSNRTASSHADIFGHLHQHQPMNFEQAVFPFNIQKMTDNGGYPLLSAFPFISSALGEFQQCPITEANTRQVFYSWLAQNAMLCSNEFRQVSRAMNLGNNPRRVSCPELSLDAVSYTNQNTNVLMLPAQVNLMTNFVQARNDGCEGVHFNHGNHARGQNSGGTVSRNVSGSHLWDLHEDGELSELLDLRDVSDDEFVALMKNAPPAEQEFEVGLVGPPKNSMAWQGKERK